MRSLGKGRGAALLTLACLLCDPAVADAQTGAAAPAQQSPESRLPGPEFESLPQGDPYLRLPGTSGRDDPLLERYRHTSRALSQSSRGETVLRRERVGYDPQGLPVGSFTLFPAVTTSASATDNVFRLPDKQADVFLTGRAEGVLRSDWSRHALTLDGMAEKDLHAEYTSENNFNYRARVNGRLDIRAADWLSMEAVRERITQDRGGTGDILETRRPTSYDHTGVMLAGRVGGRGKVQGQIEITYSTRDYNRAESPSGVPRDVRYRDMDDYGVTGQAGYRLGAMTNLFVSGAHTWRRYPFSDAIVRDADIIEVLGGVEGEVTPLIRGRLGLGYITADFAAPTIETRRGLGVDARIDFLVTELSTVRLTARRDFRNVDRVTSSAAFTTMARAAVDHELFRNVILSPAVSYELADYVDEDRKAAVVSAEFGARWLINHRLRANGLIQYRDRNASGFDTKRDYSSISVVAGLTFQL